jgi:hypothetical protein
MPKKITNKKPSARVIATREAGVVTLMPGAGTVVSDEQWEAIQKTQVTYRNKKVPITEMLEAEGHIEIEDAEGAAEGPSRVTRNEVPPALMGALPGQGGDDASRREDEETEEGAEAAGEAGTRRHRRRHTPAE